MAKFNPAADMDKYDTGGNGKFFSLKDDGDSAIVRILANSVEDIDGYTVHKIKVDGYDRQVNCLRNYEDPLDVCPLCEAKYRTMIQFYIPVYNTETGDVSIWCRGKNFYPQLAELSSRCNPLVSYPITIERHGKAGDKETKYEMYADVEDGVLLEDIEEEIPTPEEAGAVLDKTFEELTTYVNTGSFDGASVNNQSNADSAVERRRRDISGGNSVASRRRGMNSDTPL